MAVSDEHRERFEFLGREKVRDLLASDMLVQHLVMPAWAWLEELHDKEKSAPAVEQVHNEGIDPPVENKPA